ncbi:MAG: hypothetical protein LQ345_004792 [Seirophora villosa]|nr:MAG: hypothetical protein LQ345_004792 [Seirophora villosa]
MSENNPPLTTSTTTATATAPSDINTRGIPYYEKLKRDLRETLQRKRLLDKNMATLEDQIYRFEAAYLEETSSAGNIIRGFDNYIKGSALLGRNFARVEYPEHTSSRTDAYVRAAGIGVSESERWADANERDKHEGRGGE